MKFAGFAVKAFKAVFSESPYSIALRIFLRKVLLSFRSAVVKQKLIRFFSRAAGFVGANSQCFRSLREIDSAS